jgi:hypothetical protein
MAFALSVTALGGGLTQERMLLRFTEIMRAGLTSWWGLRAMFAYPMRERLPMISAPFLAIVLNESLAGSSREAARLATATREFLEQP